MLKTLMNWILTSSKSKSWLIVIIGFTLSVAICVYGQNSPKADTEATQDRPLTPAERRGRAIYLRGESQREIVARVGDLDVPATTVNCAGCHGRKGEGKTEAGVTAGNLTWANLVKPYGHEHPTGRKHGPFTESSFATAVVGGMDPAGNSLVVAMPRYRMSIDDMSDLVAYIKRLEFDRDPGLASETIDVGVPLPTSGALAETGQAIRQAMSAYFEELNSHGGIYNRKINLHFPDSAGADLMTGLRALTKENHAFVFLGGVSAGADKQISDLARAEEVPFIGPATLLPFVEQPPNRYVFYLLPGVSEQAVALVNFADQQLSARKQRAAIAFPSAALSTAAAEAAFSRAKQTAWSDVVKVPYATFDANALAQQLKASNTATVFIFATGTDLENFVRAAAALNWTPNVLSLGVFTSGGVAANVPASFSKKVFLSFPTVPADITTEGAAEFRSLSEKYKLPQRHAAAQIAALAAAKTFIEGLKRVGADLSREQLVTALESLYDFDTGFTPKLIFGPNRRIGASGAYVITIDAETKALVPASGWVPANE